MKPVWLYPDHYEQRQDHIETNCIGQKTIFWKVTIKGNNRRPSFKAGDGNLYSWRIRLVSDGNSAPPLCRAWFPQELGLPTAFMHDSGYQDHTLPVLSRDGNWYAKKVDRKKMDSLLLEGWIAQGVNEKEARTAYKLVRAFGLPHWYHFFTRNEDMT